jgi:hypothetical protein
MSGIKEAPIVITFDKTNANWMEQKEYTTLFLKGIQNWMNDKLRAQGYLFLNTVHHHLGLPDTAQGQTDGWALDRGDGFVDFGLDSESAYDSETKSFTLTFNISGYILDKL